MKPSSVEQRFWGKVNKRGPILREELGPCWLWTAAKDKHGYPRFWDGTKLEGGNRVSWLLAGFELPKDIEVCHKCDNPSCVNPSHLFLGDQKANLQDMTDKGRRVNADRHGERNPHSKLTESQVTEIRTRLNTMSQPQLAAIYKVTHSTISRIKLGKTWRNMPRLIISHEIF